MTGSSRISISMAAAAAILAAGTLPAAADGVADFYNGKQINIVVGYSPGGGYDTYTRLLATAIGRHIPGNPEVIVTNMPGGGSMKAANYTYRAPRKIESFPL